MNRQDENDLKEAYAWSRAEAKYWFELHTETRTELLACKQSVTAIKAKAARYRAALEEIVAGMWIEQGSRDEMFQSIQMAVAIAHRALPPEEGAGDHGELVK